MSTMSVLYLLCLHYVYYACTMLVLCLYYVYYAYCACTMSTMPVLCLLSLYYAYYDCTVYYACTMPVLQGPPKRPDTFENLIEIKRVDENN